MWLLKLFVHLKLTRENLVLHSVLLLEVGIMVRFAKDLIVLATNGGVTVNSILHGQLSVQVIAQLLHILNIVLLFSIRLRHLNH